MIKGEDFHGTVPANQAAYLAAHINAIDAAEERQPALFGETCVVGHLDGSTRLAAATWDGEPVCGECAESLRAQGCEVTAL